MSEDPQSPSPGSRSGAAAEGSQSQSHPHPVSEGRQSPGLEEAREHLKTMAVHYDDDTYDQELFDAAVAYAKALAATPSQGGDPTAYVSPAFAPLYASEAKRRGAATPSQEEGPAGVDLRPFLRDLLHHVFAERATKVSIGERIKAALDGQAQAPASSPRDLEASDFDAYWGDKGEKWKGWLDIKSFAREVWDAARAGEA